MLKNFKIEYIILVFILFVSSLLMFSSFSFQDGSMVIHSTVYSDFSAHIPMVRSFSWGDNFPPEYPLFPGEFIRYHFLFYAFVGLLEKIGFRIDYALNLPSILGFSFLCYGIYLFGKKVFDDSRVGILALIFFLFNGSLGFLDFFEKFPLHFGSLIDIYMHKEFTSFAPWNGSDISAFWNYNIYTNQRHLAPAFALLVFFILTTLKAKIFERKKQLIIAVSWGGIIGIFPFFHQPSLPFFALYILCFLFFFKRLRTYSLIVGTISGLLILFQWWFWLKDMGQANQIKWVFGYLAFEKMSLKYFFVYWFKNLGLHFVLIPAGFFLSPKKGKLLFLPLAVIFVLGNCFQFAREMAANHKFFSFFILLGGNYSAYCLIRFWEDLKKWGWGRIIPAAITLFLMTFSGLIDIFVLKNGIYYTLLNKEQDALVKWIKDYTKPADIFLNSHYLYHPASLAGRKIFLGWPYFAWSAGYKTEKRIDILKEVYESNSFERKCELLEENKISYLTVEDMNTGQAHDPIIELSDYYPKIKPVYFLEERKLALYSTKQICHFSE